MHIGIFSHQQPYGQRQVILGLRPKALHRRRRRRRMEIDQQSPAFH